MRNNISLHSWNKFTIFAYILSMCFMYMKKGDKRKYCYLKIVFFFTKIVYFKTCIFYGDIIYNMALIFIQLKTIYKQGHQ